MRFLATSCLLAAAAFSSALASALADPEPSPTDVYVAVITNAPELERRQGAVVVNPGAALTDVAGAGVVTNYNINSQVAISSGINIAVVYTQTFARVPDQWPSPQPGTIGMGGLRKRDVEAVPTMVEEAQVVQTEYLMQPVVLHMATEVVTVPVRRVTSVVVVETVTVGYGNGTLGNSTALGSNGTTVASLGFGTGTGTYRPFATGSAGLGTYRPRFTGTAR